ncbi:MAG: hypothetical protein EOO90_17050 [Pedobacter sp.]|nr:MAG: hypothetical protein EOO90_17050 [Pedobacter sp.]
MQTIEKSLIDFIVSERQKQGAEILARRDENKPVLNVTNIFNTSDNPDGVLDKEKFRLIYTDLGREQLLAFQAFLKAMKNKQKLSTTPYSLTDKKGKDYHWIKISGTNGNREFRMNCFPGLDRLLSIYLMDMAIIDLDFDELYHESQK